MNEAKNFRKDFKEVILKNVSKAEIILDYLATKTIEGFETSVSKNLSSGRSITIPVKQVEKDTGVTITPAIVALLIETSNIYGVNVSYWGACREHQDAVFTLGGIFIPDIIESNE